MILNKSNKLMENRIRFIVIILYCLDCIEYINIINLIIMIFKLNKPLELTQLCNINVLSYNFKVIGTFYIALKYVLDLYHYKTSITYKHQIIQSSIFLCLFHKITYKYFIIIQSTGFCTYVQILIVPTKNKTWNAICSLIE